MRTVSNFLHSSAVVGVAGVLLCGGMPLHADLSLVDMFRNIVYTQTSGAAPTTPVNFFLNLEATMKTSADFTAVSVSYPGAGSPQSLPLVNPTEFGIGPGFSTQAAMDAAYPMGLYTFSGSGGISGNQHASLDYLVDAFTSDIPALDAATYNALQNLNPANPFTFNFNSSTPNINANNSATFLTVFGSSFGFSGAPSSTSATMAGGTLNPNTTYEYELDFSDRISGQDPLNPTPTLIGFDVRTDGFFTTTPEPSAALPLGIVLLAAAAWRLRRKVTSTATR